MKLSTRAFIPASLVCALLLAGCPIASNSDTNGPITTQSTGGEGGNTGNGGPYNVTGTLGSGGGGNPGTNTVVATASTSGIFKVAIGSSATLSITFVTSDGGTVQGLGVEGLGTLPADWTGTKTPKVFGCQTVSSGSGCVLNLTYTPTAVGPGSFTLSYIWLNASGSAQTLGGTITINYLGTVHNHIIGTPSPTGQINAVVGGPSQSVTVNFVTDDGYSATALDVASLPAAGVTAGWSSSAGLPFTCASVSTGNGCQLTLSFTPPAYESGTLTLPYTYVDNAGSAQTGSLNIPYAATTDDTAVGTASPSGQITAVVGSGSQPVSVTFTTSDGEPATNLALTTDLSSLPSGWSSTASSFACATFATGNGCQLPLSFQPTSYGSGTLTLNYSYVNDSGDALTGSVNINYTATTNDSVQGTANPSGQITSSVGTAEPVTVTFNTNDGAQATNFAITSGLASLPSGWSSTASSFSCSTVSTGSSCQLALTYDPSNSGTAGTLVLGFSYTDDAGNAATGTVSLPYTTN